MAPALRGAAFQIVFVLFSALLALVLLALVEGVLRVVGLGDPCIGCGSRLGYQQIRLPVLTPVQRPAGGAVLRPVDHRLPFHSLMRDKPEGTLRVFTFGGSATAGLGYSPNVSFASFLGEMLRESDPNGRFEVSNLGIVGLSSDEVKLLVADACERYAPDVIVVYSGNNEFLELHARKYALSQWSLAERLLDRLRDTNLRRLADRALRGPPSVESLTEQALSDDELRLTQETIIREVEVSPSEMSEVIDRYEANLREMVDAASAARTPVVLMTVASNWRWRGREDLPAGWIDELLGELGAESGDAVASARRALSLVDERLASAPLRERAHWLFRRAVLHERIGDWRAARADYRGAMNEDPHLRRALDAMNERVVRVAADTGSYLVDSVEVLTQVADRRIVGFDEFYDYVHFTPRGALHIAAALLEALLRLGLHRSDASWDAAAFVHRRLEEIGSMSVDALAVDRWVGFAFDRSLLADRDLWKYDRMQRALDRRLQTDPRDVYALAFRGNARYFELGGGPEAAADYRAALAIHPDARDVRRNLERLIEQGRARAAERSRP